MSDALAILDGAVACVSALLMPEELETLINFLRGESWDEVPPPPAPPASSSTTARTTAAAGDVRWRIPNVLTGCYNYLPLAIVADVSLVSASSSGERAALVHNFERHEFRVFAVNLLPEGCPAENALRQKYGSSSAIVRLSCMEAAQAWCDAVYAERDGLPARSPTLGSKRGREEAAAPPLSYMARRQHTSGPRTRRALFILRCCANESAAHREDVSRARRSCDPLMLLLHDISALAALCRAREAAHRARIQFSVLLLPDDLAYGGALLAEALREPLSREYCVQLFRGSAASAARRDDAELTAFLRRLETWMNLPTAPPHPADAEGEAKAVTEQEQRHQQHQQQQCGAADVEAAERVRQRESDFFFVRRDNLPLCCFLREALRRFPVILHPVALRQLQALWATRRQLGDVATGLHALLCPFAHSASAREGCASSTVAPPPAVAPATDTAANGGRNGNDGMCRHADTVDILNAVLVTAGQLADGDLLNEAVAFAVLYEDVVWRRPTRLQRIPGFVAVLERLWRRWGNESSMDFHAALASCVPVYTPSSTLQDASYQRPGEAAAEGARAVVVLPAPMRVPAAKVPLGAELMHAALLAVLPPQESLEELRRAVGQCGSHGGPRGEAGENSRDRACAAAAMQGSALSENNFFNPSIPNSVRLLHLLTAHALGQGSCRQKYVSFAVLQRVCQISDEALVRALKELQLAGLVKLDGSGAKARAALDG
ncbi:uncharacterized protein Tco025E_04520 [Trypanosoma conorhini]|uniref:Uncharacterized protein n=1 Tax=Trypanosoma conorhini TaxID=83891 RepID=A0A3R7MP31_9TRYP|nr:uncharacterized protein Tco025E_04520 [Trypanosoma conorhini]RNF18374.1 hypothetical protein Tco025E_04520 [Trypanosoma conorhini]